MKLILKHGKTESRNTLFICFCIRVFHENATTCNSRVARIKSENYRTCDKKHQVLFEQIYDKIASMFFFFVHKYKLHLEVYCVVPFPRCKLFSLSFFLPLATRRVSIKGTTELNEEHENVM